MGFEPTTPTFGKVSALRFHFITPSYPFSKAVDLWALLLVSIVLGSLLRYSRIGSPALPSCFPR